MGDRAEVFGWLVRRMGPRLEDCAPERAFLLRLPPPVLASLAEGQRFCVPTPFAPAPFTGPRDIRQALGPDVVEFFAPEVLL